MWHKISLDESLSIQEAAENQRKSVRSYVELLEHTISKLLTNLGVDCTQPREVIGFQQQQLGINVVSLENSEDIAQLCRAGKYGYSESVKGIYIFKNFEPKYFIPDPEKPGPFLPVIYYDFTDDVMINMGGIGLS